MRRAATVLASVVAFPTVAVVLPVVSAPQPRPHPVAASVHRLALQPGPPGVLASVEAPSTDAFDLVGASWDAGTLAPGVRLQVRVQRADTWSAWTDLGVHDAGPDRGSPDAQAARSAVGARQSAEPLWVGRADGVAARVLPAGNSGQAPGHLALVLVDGGRSAADAAPGRPQPLGTAVAEAAAARPTVYTRAQWGADESLRRSRCPGGPDYGSTIKLGFLHHTDTSNSYSAADVPAIIRSIYAYHVRSNGWCDVGYNFLVDKFGRIWEGRYGGIDRPVIGAHTGGFNTDTFGASIIGTYSATRPSTATSEAVARLWAWKLGAHYRDPEGSEVVRAASFSQSRYPAGSLVRLRTLSGHRDADQTSCPGDAAYALLPGLRQRATTLLGAGLVDPRVVSSQKRYGSSGVLEVTAGVVTDQTWTLTVTDGNGHVVRTVGGTAGRSRPVDARWDGRTGAGVAAAPGTYTLRLDSAAGSRTAVPYSTTGRVLPPVSVSGPSRTRLGATVGLRGSAPAGSSVDLRLHRRNVPGWSDGGRTTAASDGSFSFTYRANDDYRWMATAAGYDSAPGLTQVFPTVTGPRYVDRDATVTLRGTALPSTAVQVYLHRRGTTGYQAGPSVPASADGAWSASFVAGDDYRWYAVSADRRSPAGLTQVIRPPTATGLARTAYGAHPTLQGTGTPGHPVELWLHKRGASGYRHVANVYAGGTGRWSWAYAADDDYRWYARNTAGTSVPGLTQVYPTITGPATAPRWSRVTLTGTAFPDAVVDVWFHRRGTTGYTVLKKVVADASGRFSVGYIASDDHRWFAAWQGRRSAGGLTQVR